MHDATTGDYAIRERANIITGIQLITLGDRAVSQALPIKAQFARKSWLYRGQAFRRIHC
jgi:hypothetical protein